MEIIVIGGNAAGPSAAAKAKRTNPEANVRLFESGPYISTGTCELPYLFSNTIDDYKKLVFYSPEQFFEEKKVAVNVRHKVESINRREKKIVVKNQNDHSKLELPYDKLIITTGSKPKFPDIASPVNNLFTLKSVADYVEIKDFIDSNVVKNVIIIGAGYIGIEIAENLKKKNYKVTLIEKAKLPMSSSEKETSSLIKNILESEQIETFFGVSNIKFNQKNGIIYSVNIDGRILETDMVIAAIGVMPNSGLAVASNLAIGKLGGISVDKKLKTTDPDIYAAGDCIEVINAITNLPGYLPLATLAHSQGHIAGENAAGGNVFYNPVIKNIAVKIFDNVLVSVGISTEDAKSNNIRYETVDVVMPNLVKVMPGSSNIYGKLIFEKSSKRILGAEFFGKSEVTGYGDLIASIILQKGKTDILEKTNFNYTPPSSPFINILSFLGRKATEK